MVVFGQTKAKFAKLGNSQGKSVIEANNVEDAVDKVQDIIKNQMMLYYCHLLVRVGINIVLLKSVERNLLKDSVPIYHLIKGCEY